MAELSSVKGAVHSNVKFLSTFPDVKNNDDKNLPPNFSFEQALTVPRIIRFYVNSIEWHSVNKCGVGLGNFPLW